MTWIAGRVNGISLCPKVKNGSIVVLNVGGSKRYVSSLKEGTIVAIETVKGIIIAHVYLGMFVNSNGKKYVVTAPFKFPRTDPHFSHRRLKGILCYCVENNKYLKKVNSITLPFILLIVRTLLSLSYFISKVVYTILNFHFKQTKETFNILKGDFIKWLKIWIFYVRRRL